MSIPCTLVGNTTAEPELRFTQGGIPVCGFTVAVNERKLNRQTNEWEDGETTFVRVSVWREYAEHVAASVGKGQRVVVTGKLANRAFEDKEGNSRLSLEMTAEEVAISLRYGTAAYTRAASTGGGQQAGGSQQWGQQGGAAAQAPADAWASAPSDLPF